MHIFSSLSVSGQTRMHIPNPLTKQQDLGCESGCEIDCDMRQHIHTPFQFRISVSLFREQSTVRSVAALVYRFPTLNKNSLSLYFHNPTHSRPQTMFSVLGFMYQNCVKCYYFSVPDSPFNNFQVFIFYFFTFMIKTQYYYRYCHDS